MKDRAQQSTQELPLEYDTDNTSEKQEVKPDIYLQYRDLYFAILIMMLEIGIKEKG